MQEDIEKILASSHNLKIAECVELERLVAIAKTTRYLEYSSLRNGGMQGSNTL